MMTWPTCQPDRVRSNRVIHSGFSLIELIVSIGIIAILLGLLLPAINRVQVRSRDINCQSNMHQILTALSGYADENHYSLPYGFHWARTRKSMGTKPLDWEEAAGNNGEFVTWASQIGKWLNRGKIANVENDPVNYSAALRCPEALQAGPHFLSYAINMIVAVDPRAELKRGSVPRAQIVPANTSMMRNETAVIWDTAIFGSSRVDINYPVGLDIDGQRFWDGAGIPQYRYFSQIDPFTDSAGSKFGQAMPVNLNVGTAVYHNIDPADASVGAPYEGNLRFRHRGNQCNVGFFDGHIEAFTAVVNSDQTVASHNALRRLFMTKWPNGVSPNPSFPH